MHSYILIATLLVTYTITAQCHSCVQFSVAVTVMVFERCPSCYCTREFHENANTAIDFICQFV